ncbi:MAG: stage II sporulation protein M [Anaerolineales bacterium]
MTVWLHNLRAIGLAALAGLFTFGVLGILVMMLPFVLIGYFTVVAAGIGLSPWLFLLGFVLPHGIFEIPAILMASGAMLRMGATLAAPASGRTMSEALIEAFADWCRIMVALAIPMFLVAATLEIYITPRVAILLFGM